MQQSGFGSDISLHKAYGTLTILLGDPKLSHVSLRFYGAREAICFGLLLHTR
jgi:hypothetical protein